MATRSMEELINEAASIGIRFKEMPKNATKDPHTVARVVAIYQESGLSTQESIRRTRGFSASTLYMWARGKGTNGQDWPALQAAIAKRDGAALAATMNDSMPGARGPIVESKPSITVGRSSPRAIAVTRWIDSTGNEHETEYAAEAASYVHDVEVAADALASSLGIAAATQFIVHADQVLALADAIRSEIDFRRA